MFYQDRNSISFSPVAVLGMISIPKDTLWAKMAARPPAIASVLQQEGGSGGGEECEAFFPL